MEPRPRTYFIDESGDGVLFGPDGRVMVGSPGCLKHFYLGLADVADPEGLTEALAELRGDSHAGSLLPERAINAA